MIVQWLTISSGTTMAKLKKNKMPQAPTPTSLKAAEANNDKANVEDVDFDEIVADDNTKVDNTKTLENNGVRKAKLTLKLTEVESLLFFNIIRFNGRPEAIDWEKVAEHSGLKPKSVKVGRLYTNPPLLLF